ncbi:2-phospho-L-lactate guanylyltransferase [Allocatelliglobosispora scoriae]|uniref:2-phospho-L-lactate guanylyltransferase n=1 Tax=Allocatelliglobosispora scoriae TaxID=643052 RepID=A0A841BXD1_9ACTN|nr:2-phospho-L-lactate guanylyltransferase [Allocatelliglobosispora scoriae]MBB5872176.1 2-phospho-L-lactate guanylyltransferase [Allocatelliglobosispora scoriae]
MTWTVVVPLKSLADGKSRLRGAAPHLDHDRLVLALAVGTVEAALKASEVGRVVVVTGDAEASSVLGAMGAEITADPGGGLNAAIRAAANTETGPVAALLGDVGALVPVELDAALAAGSAYPRWFVADAEGTGTVLLGAVRGDRLEPRFGPGSAAAHAGSGATALTGDWPTLRHDVDTPADLARARMLGLDL